MIVVNLILRMCFLFVWGCLRWSFGWLCLCMSSIVILLLMSFRMCCCFRIGCLNCGWGIGMIFVWWVMLVR